MHSLKPFIFSFSKRGSNTWSWNLHSYALSTNISPLHSNDGFGIRVAYINFIPCLTIQDAGLNSEYHAPCKYPFYGVLLVGSRSRTIIPYFSRGLDVGFTLGHQPYFEHVTYEWPYFHSKIYFNLDFSRCLRNLANKFNFFCIYTYFLLEYNS